VVAGPVAGLVVAGAVVAARPGWTGGVALATAWGALADGRNAGRPS
jgi:hypothetical protein